MNPESGLQAFLLLGALLFVCGVVCMASKRNAIGILMGVELILNAANVNLVAFNRFSHGGSGAGLRLDTAGATGTDKPLEKAYLGAQLVQEGERLMVRRVVAGTPAYEQGLNTNDQIVALNNMRANKDFFDARMAEKHPGDPLSLTIFRSDDLSTLLIKLGRTTDAPYRILAVENPSDEQKQIYRAWVGAPLTK